jgi:hypothetical protein
VRGHEGGAFVMSPLAQFVLSLILLAFPPGKHPEVETREAGAARLEVVARALADSAHQAGAAWPGGEKDLARAEVAAFGWSMGFRLDVQLGLKRGPGHEACFSDLQPAELRRFATFPTAGLSNAQLAEQVVGLDYQSLRRCFDAGTAAFLHVHDVALKQCRRHGPIVRSTFALYANGNWCSSGGRDWIERYRFATYQKFQAREVAAFPAWYAPPRGES